MSTAFVLIAALSCLLRAECLEFYIARDLSSTKELPENIWSRVEVLGLEDTQTENIKARVSIPATLSYSDSFGHLRALTSTFFGSKYGVSYYAGDLFDDHKYFPRSWALKDVSIFFANDTKQVLEVQLKGVVKGTFYSKPHMVAKEAKAGETETVVRDDYVEISGDFPRSWLPIKSTRISATVKAADGKHYNYYGTQNAALSITDLMVVEEFKQLTS